MKHENDIICTPWGEAFKESRKIARVTSFKQFRNVVFALPKLFKELQNVVYHVVPAVTWHNNVHNWRFLKAKQTNINLSKYFYRHGNGTIGEKFLANVLQFYYETEWTGRVAKSTAVANYNKCYSTVMQTIEKASLPIKLVPRFIKKRVRRVPTYVSNKFQRGFIWRELVGLGKIAYGGAVRNIAAEINRLCNKPKTSTVLGKFPKFYQEIYKTRVYIRKPKIIPQDYKRIYKNLRNAIWSKLSEKEKKNKYFIKLQIYKELKSESKAERFMSTKSLLLRKRFYKSVVFDKVVEKYLAVVYGYSSKITKLMNAQ